MSEPPQSISPAGRPAGFTLPGSMRFLGHCQPSATRTGQAFLLRGSIPEFFVPEAPIYSVSFVTAGRARYERRRNRSVTRSWASPGGFNVAAGWGQSAFRFEGTLESLNLTIGDSDLGPIVEREFDRDPARVTLQEVERNTMPEVVALGREFAALIRSPRRGGRLYQECLWNQLILQLIWNCSSLTRARIATPGRLSDARMQRVLDFIEDALSEELSLDLLADVAGLSPNYFLCAFKRTTGLTPHQFLIDRRIQRAREYLQNPSLTLLQVALRVGFSSQSHFTSVFRRVTKLTPGSYRQQVLGTSHPRPE